MREALDRLREAIRELVEARSRVKPTPRCEGDATTFLLIDHALKQNRHILRLLMSEEKIPCEKS